LLHRIFYRQWVLLQILWWKETSVYTLWYCKKWEIPHIIMNSVAITMSAINSCILTTLARNHITSPCNWNQEFGQLICLTVYLTVNTCTMISNHHNYTHKQVSFYARNMFLRNNAQIQHRIPTYKSALPGGY
jgi:hypothetical protein